MVMRGAVLGQLSEHLQPDLQVLTQLSHCQTRSRLGNCCQTVWYDSYARFIINHFIIKHAHVHLCLDRQDRREILKEVVANRDHHQDAGGESDAAPEQEPRTFSLLDVARACARVIDHMEGTQKVERGLPVENCRVVYNRFVHLSEGCRSLIASS